VEGKGKEAVVADLMALFRSARISCVLAELWRHTTRNLYVSADLICSWFQTLAVFWMLYAFFWV